MKALKKYIYIGLPILGVLFYLQYLRIAAIDMVYSDYIRLINAYLPDVWDPEKFFVADLLTRIPVNYLERIVNVTFFGYSVTFDRVLGVLGFGASAFILGIVCRKLRVGLGWYTAMMVFMFSLNKWEMLYNGTGWAHFAAFACFFYHYMVLDRVYRKRAQAGDLIRLAVLPTVITIGVAGPYCAIYTMTLVLAYGFILVRNLIAARGPKHGIGQAGTAGHITDPIGGGSGPRGDAYGLPRGGFGSAAGIGGLDNRQIMILLACAIWPLLAYIWSNSQAVYEHAGAVEGSLIGTLFTDPVFFLRFLLKAFASIVFGTEFINRHLSGLPDAVWYLLGFLILASYFLALWMNFYYGVYEKTLMPLMLLAGGGMNHLVVMVSRWIFMKDTYGMSSRYALQYQVGILGILLTFALVYRRGAGRRAEADASQEAGRRTETDASQKVGRRTETDVSQEAAADFAAHGGRTAGRKLAAAGSKKGRSPWIRALAFLITGVILAGNLATTVEEYNFGQHRKNHNLEVREVLLNFENVDEETLQANLEFRKPGTREALQILKDHGWNIFREP